MYTKRVCTITVLLLLSQALPARAGWTGLINGLGKGWAAVNVRSSTLESNYVSTVTNLQSPSSVIPPTLGFLTNGPLPLSAATNTYARIKGLPGGVWSPGLNAANSGDGTDAPELESRFPVTPADCASLTMDTKIDQTQAQFESNAFNGTITVNAFATAGTALWLRGFEFTGDMADVPPDDPSTVPNESIEYLKLHATPKFDMLMAGPFQFGGSNGACPLIIPFSLTSGKLQNLIFATDGVAKSNPMLLNCPSNIVVSCGTPVVYAQPSYAACGDVTFTYNPPAGSSFPVGTTPVVISMSDTNGNSTNCTFTVTVVDDSTPTVAALPVLTGQCSVQVPVPKATNTCGVTTTIATGTTSDPLTYSSQGTNIVHWSFNNGNGHISTANQTVIVKDTTPPQVPSLGTVTGSCSAPVTLTPPTTSDNCAGTVTGTTTTVFPITAQGTTAVVWRFNDGNGNTSTATQNVVVAGLTFKGFYSPIGTVSNLCTAPVVINQGSVSPIKFDLFCGTTPITAGTPPIVKIQLWTGCAFVSEPISINAVYQNDWHFNWDTTGWAKAVYRVLVILPDGTTRYVFVRIK